jgi:glyoxylate reductase
MSVGTRKMQVFVTGHICQDNHAKLAGVTKVSGNTTQNSLSDHEFSLATKGQDAILCVVFDRMDSAFMQSHPHLKLVANCGVGYNNIDVEAASKLGILVTNTPDVVTAPTADLTFALILSCARRIVEADRFVKAGLWQDLANESELFGTNLTGKTLGIIGMGRIGEAVARRAAAFQMKIIYSSNSSHPETEAFLLSQYGAVRHNLPDLLAASDVISIHCPLSAQTKHLLSKDEFARMKPSVILINASRGPIIDESAMLDALKNKQIAACGLDVFEFEPVVPKALLTMDNVVLTPHIGTASSEIRDAMANLAIEGMLKAFAGQLPDNAVNKEVWSHFLERLKH